MGHLVRERHWQLRERSMNGETSSTEKYILEPPTEAEEAAIKKQKAKEKEGNEEDAPTDWHELKTFASVLTACKKSVDANQVELAEYLYSHCKKNKKSGGKLDASAVTKALCFDMSG